MKFFFCLIVILVQLLNVTNSGATSLIYTSNTTNYQANNYVFRKNDIAQGFVRLSNGFTVLPDACATMDLLFSVSGAIDLRETGTMQLLRDCVFDSAVTLSSGGNIKGYGHSIILNGNLTIPTGKVLHISGDTIIDGQGNKLTIGANAQIFVDTNVTLTLCNLYVTNQQHALTFPPLRCGAQTSKLALDNVTFIPVGNFLFSQGQLFIHDDVAITGTSAFIYTSPMPSYITSGACWYFDINTTLSVAPATFTDAPYTLKTTYTNNNFIRMADATSMLFFDGCSLQTTLTGCRFTKGTIAFDNSIACLSQSAVVLTSTGVQLSTQDFGTGNAVYASHWSPCGKYLAAGAGFSTSPYRGNQLVVYSLNGSLLTTTTNLSYGTGSSTYVSALRWSADGRFLAACGTPTTPSLSGYQLQVYTFNGSTLTLAAKASLGSTGYNLCWSPDGQYIAVVGPFNTLKVFRFTGSALILAAQTSSFSATPTCLHWSNNGKNIAVVLSNNGSGPEIYIYRFDGTSLTLITSVEYGATLQGIAWSPDDRYLAVAGAVTSSALKVYRFDGVNLIPIAQTNYGSNEIWCTWSPDGRYIAVSGSSSGSNGNEVQIYSFNDSSLTLLKNAQINLGSGSFVSGGNAWSNDGKYFSLSGSKAPTPVPGETHAQLEVYRLGYVADSSTQALSNSIVFGDSAKGSTYDARVNVLAGARVNLFGAMSYDGINAVLLGEEEQ